MRRFGSREKCPVCREAAPAHEYRPPASRLRLRAVTVAAALMIVSLITATESMAGTASVAGTTLSYVAAAGEANQVSIFASVFSNQGPGIFVRELGAAPVLAGAGCVLADTQIAFCGAAPTAMDVSLGDGDDTLASNDLGGVAHGGAGNDSLVVSQVSSGQLFGDDGNDTLIPAAGTWTLNGGAGDDTISSGCAGFCSGFGPMTVVGGAGVDTFSYAQHAEVVTVTLDDVANDGGGAGHDNVGADIENVIGGDAGDSLTGNSNNNRLDDGGGDGDTLTGGGGDDTLLSIGSLDQLSGGSGNDLLKTTGPPGADSNVLAGGTGTDTADFSGRSDPVTITLDGIANDGAGHDNVAADIENLIGSSQGDVLIASAGANLLNGGGGDDLLRGAAGSDHLIGGPGTDTVDYSDHPAAVTIDPRGQPNSGNATDGAVGARDTIDGDNENLAGGPGDDRLLNTAVANRFSGGAGIDTVDYTATINDVTVTLDGAANDGPAGELDNVATDVENVDGGDGNDTLIGNAQTNRINGGPGNDTVDGKFGADTLTGGPGTDLADYSDRTAPLQVMADGTPASGNADDGAAGARDSVAADIEDLRWRLGQRHPDRQRWRQCDRRSRRKRHSRRPGRR
jgi:Ca2+-binding RTX toxin-like protein